MTDRTEVLVVGGGPAGLAAASAAARAGKRVTLLDDQASPGGQIWRPGLVPTPHADDPIKQRALADLQQSGAVLKLGRRVISSPRPGVLHALVETTDTVESFTFDSLVLATGARERFLPFPGWTLPGVFGAGGLQALVKGGLSVEGKRVVVAGTGPLLLAVATHLQQSGATIAVVTEQAPSLQLLPLLGTLLRRPAKLIGAARLRSTLRSVPYRTGCWPVAAEGEEKLTAVRFTDGRQTWTEPCDLLACGFHLVANTELPMLLGCKLDGDFVQVDPYQQTSLPGIFCAGEPTGIAGVDAALIAGRIAGLAAAGRLEDARRLHARSRAERAFGHALDRAFALRPELRTLPQPNTIICRCEDVPYGELTAFSSWTDAKLQTRCGMGACQGRICGPAVQVLFRWRNHSVRPPLFPVPLAALCADLIEDAELPETQSVQTQETP